MNHVFRSEVAAFPNIFDGCSTLNDFIEGLKAAQSVNVKFVEHGFEALIETIVNHYKLYSDYEVIASTEDEFKIGAIADKRAVGIFFVDNPDKLLTKNNGLVDFLWQAEKKKKITHYVIFSNSTGINENTLQNYFLDPPVNYVFYGNNEIVALIDGKTDFWDFLRAEIAPPKVEKPKPKILRADQVLAVQKCKENKIGKVIAPTGSGKSLIEAEVILDAIKSNPGAVCVIASPRIVLTYQLIQDVIDHLSANDKDAQYVNLNSGKFAQDPVKDKMRELGLLSRDIPSTTDPDIIQDWYNKAEKNKVPFIIGATYHSAWKLLKTNIPINLIIADECHNLVIKTNERLQRKTVQFKKAFHKIKADHKYFFTATPVKDKKKKDATAKVRRWGMQNRRLFGTTIYRAYPQEMIEAGIVLPPYVHVVNVDKYNLDKIKRNTEDVDDNIEALADMLKDSFIEHQKKVLEESSNPAAIGTKLLVVCRGEAVLSGFFTLKNGLFRSKVMRDFIKDYPDVALYGMSTSSGALIYEPKEGAAFAECFEHIESHSPKYKTDFMLKLRQLKPEQKAIIFHIRMIGEGVDVPGITGVMSYQKMGIIATSQTIGRAMRVCVQDRELITSGEIQPEDYHKPNGKMIKPRCWVIMPVYSSETAAAKTEIAKMVKRLRRKDYTPTDVFYSKPAGHTPIPPTLSSTIGPGNSNLELEVRHELEKSDYQRLRRKAYGMRKKNLKAVKGLVGS